MLRLVSHRSARHLTRTRAPQLPLQLPTNSSRSPPAPQAPRGSLRGRYFHTKDQFGDAVSPRFLSVFRSFSNAPSVASPSCGVNKASHKSTGNDVNYIADRNARCLSNGRIFRTPSLRFPTTHLSRPPYPSSPTTTLDIAPGHPNISRCKSYLHSHPASWPVLQLEPRDNDVRRRRKAG